jgi:hypothetical protein
VAEENCKIPKEQPVRKRRTKHLKSPDSKEARETKLLNLDSPTTSPNDCPFIQHP